MKGLFFRQITEDEAKLKKVCYCLVNGRLTDAPYWDKKGKRWEIMEYDENNHAIFFEVHPTSFFDFTPIYFDNPEE